MNPRRLISLCNCCIAAIRSRGEKLWNSGETTEGACDWCGEDDLELTICEMEDD